MNCGPILLFKRWNDIFYGTKFESRNSGTEGVCSKFHAAASGTMVLIGSLVFDSSVACRLSTACRAEWLIEAYSEELTSSAYTRSHTAGH